MKQLIMTAYAARVISLVWAFHPNWAKTEREKDGLAKLGLPADAGREEVDIYCSPCHSFKLVVQQGLSRADWEETLSWMVNEQEMTTLKEEDQELVLNYLAKHISVEALLERRSGQ